MFKLRFLLAWLLMAAVPTQGFAAASMLFCGMGMQHVPAGAKAIAAMDAPHDHAAMHGPTSDATQGHSHAADPAQGAPSDADHTCNICAACCNGVDLVGLSHMSAMAPAPQAPLAEPFVRVHTLPSPVPDKPPRA